MSKLSFRARALDASKPMPIYLAEELPDLPDYSAINRAVPQMPSGMEKEEESEHHLQRAISGTGLIIPTPEVCQVTDLEFYERCYPPDYKMPKQHIHMQPLWEEQEAPEYDIDSEDERWLKQQRHPELTELKFEQMMDKLEKSSGQTVVTLNEAKLLLERHDDLVIAVYDYWLNKRLNTQHPLILSVKTENRPGQSANNPYLAFRRRTEKMQTRKNRKNDESSYEKMLKLRRDLARALSLLEMVARRERAKRELVRLTALIAERRYAAGDFAHHLHHDPPPRPVYTPVPLTPSNFRREPYPVPHYPPRPPPTPVDQPRQREKRPYKRRKHRHPAAGSAQGLREPGAYSSSEEEVVPRVEPASPPDDGPFAFRRKPGCYYEMPTSTLYGDPVDPDSPSKEGLFEHEIDERHRFTLTSVRRGAEARCAGLCRARACRGGRVALDRVRTPLDDLWPALRFPHAAADRARLHEEVEFETKGHRMPKELVRDYHESGKYPWRHAFRRHLARNPDLWTCPVKDEIDTKPSLENLKLDEIKSTVDDGIPSLADTRQALDESKPSLGDARPPVNEARPNLAQDRHELGEVKPFNDVRPNIDDIQPSLVDMRPLDDVRPYLEDVKPEPMDVTQDKSDISDSARTIDEYVRQNLDRVIRKRTYSACTDTSYDSDESLNPVEREFQEFIDEVHTKWPHYRAQTPPADGAAWAGAGADEVCVGADAALAVELRAPGDAACFVSAQFSLRELRGDPEPVLDVSDELLPDFSGFSDAQMESILSETDLKALADDNRKMDITDDLLEQLVKDVDGKDSFLLQGQSPEGRADSGYRKRKSESFGSSVVSVSAPKREPLYMSVQQQAAPPASASAPGPAAGAAPAAPPAPGTAPAAPPAPTPAPAAPMPTAAPAPVPTHNIILEEVNEVPIKVEKKKKEENVEEVQVAPGVQLKTVHTKHSPLKKHIITSAPRRASDDAPQILTVAVSDSLKVRLQNHLLSTQAGVLVQNGPFPPVAVAVPVQPVRDSGVSGVPGVTGVVGVTSVSGAASVSGVAGAARRVSAPLVQLAPAALAHKPLQLHAHPHAHAHAAQPLVVAPSHALHHVPPNKLKVVHANSLTQSQRTQLLAQNRVAHLPTVVSLATLADAKTPNAALLKAAPGSVAQLFEIKSGQIGKAAHLVNVVRHPTPGKTTVARLDLNDKKRQVVATFDGAIKTAVATSATATATATATRPHRVSVSLDGRQIVRASLPSLPHHVRHQIQLKNRLQVAAPQARGANEPSTSITIAAPPKPTCLPSSVVANLLHKNVQLPKGGQKIAVSGLTGQALSANVQAIAFTTATQLKARQARLIAQPRAAPVAEIVEASTAPVGAGGAVGAGAGGAGAAGALPGALAGDAASPRADADEGATNGTVRRRAADSLPMEVT